MKPKSRRVRPRPMGLRNETQRQVIARLLLLGWTAERIARKLHRTSRMIRYAISTAEFQTLYADLQREHLGRVDRQMSALLLGAVEALMRMLKNPDWRARDAAIEKVLRVHGRYVEKYDISGSLTHRYEHDHQGRFTGEILEGQIEMSEEVRTKARELLEMARRTRAIPARLTDPSAN